MLARLLRDLFGRPVPRTRPSLVPENLPPMRGRVEIVRDCRGLPHVYAGEQRDLHAALGFLQAADRFLLLDVLRHLGAGRLCELVGNLAAPAGQELFTGRRVADLDAFVCPLGFEAASEEGWSQLGERGRSLLDAFAQGVNAALRAMRGVYPAEYLVLGRPRPWRPPDSLLAFRTSAFVVTLINLDNEITFDAVRARVGDELARDLYPDAPWDAAPTSYEVLGTPPPQVPVRLPAGGSNNWAVAAWRSASGAPVLANDPHVPLVPLPSYWYHAHLECPDLRVQGGVFPGCPVFGFGHNGHLAWGCTTGFRDAWDLYRVERLPGDPTRYRTPDGSGEIQRHRVNRRARLGRSVVIEWESCGHGILYPDWRHHDGRELALRHVPADLARGFEGYLSIAEAKTVEAHRRGLELLNQGPFDFNHVYAHKDGHIGWEFFGRLPRRRRDGLFVRDAHDPEAQWQGFVPFEEMPKILNPDSGFVASANSVVDPGDSSAIATLAHFEPRYRQQRIESFLADRGPHSCETFAELQADVGCDYAGPLRDALVGLLAPLESDRSPTGDALRLLVAWKGDFPVDSVGAPLFFFTQQALARRCFKALLGRDVGGRFANGRRALPRLHRLLLDEADPLRRQLEAATARSLSEHACDAFRAAVERVVRICGPSQQGWHWGRIQRARLGNLMAEIPRLGKRFLALDAPFPGDDYTVSPARSLDEGRRLRAFVGASSRFICDLARPDEALFAHSGGPSGEAGSAFYANLSPAWQRFEYFRSALWQPHEVPDPVERIVVDARPGPLSQ
jgi:penicillin amidase